MLISDAFELYRQEYIVFRGQSRRTEEMNLLAMKSLIASCGDIPISELTFDHVRKWRDDLLKTCSQNTTRGYIIKLRVVLGYLCLKGENVLNPDVIGVPKRMSTTVTFLTPKEIDHLIECVFKPQPGYSTHNRYRNRAIMSVLSASGIRASELINLNIMGIREDATFTVIGKGDKLRLCFLDDRAMEHIEEYLAHRNDHDRALFVSEKTGKRISKTTLKDIFVTANRRCGFEKPITPHTLRHSFATDMLRNNANLYYVSKFLGHQSVQTTEHYLHYANPDLKKAYKDHHTA